MFYYPSVNGTETRDKDLQINIFGFNLSPKVMKDCLSLFLKYKVLRVEGAFEENSHFNRCWCDSFQL